MSVVLPDWSVEGVKALVTTRAEGNLALHAGETGQVADARRRLVASQGMPGEPVWMSQVHGVDVLDVDGRPETIPSADAAYTREVGIPLAVMVADCLPILVTDAAGTEVSVIHAGWRGLAAGIISKAVERFESDSLLAWIGPGIMPCHYEVDRIVRDQFEADEGFMAAGEGHWMMDLPGIAQSQLNDAGIDRVSRSNICTFCDARFFSHRENSQSGRFAAVIWIE